MINQPETNLLQRNISLNTILDNNLLIKGRDIESKSLKIQNILDTYGLFINQYDSSQNKLMFNFYEESQHKLMFYFPDYRDLQKLINDKDNVINKINELFV